MNQSTKKILQTIGIIIGIIGVLVAAVGLFMSLNK